MKQKLVIVFAAVMLMISFGCKKDSDSSSTTPTDYGALAAGQYTGNFTELGMQIPGSCAIAKVSTSSVSLTMTVNGTALPAVPGLTASDGGSGKVNISYTDGTNSISGTVNSKTLTLNITSGGQTMTFTGTKP
jgi:hypothetical protein